MNSRLRLGLLSFGLAVFAGACSCDPLPIDSHKYSCTTDAQCGPDLSCINGVCGGVAPTDGGAGGGGGTAGGMGGGTAGGIGGGTAGGTGGGTAGGTGGGSAGGMGGGTGGGTAGGAGGGTAGGAGGGTAGGAGGGTAGGAGGGTAGGVGGGTAGGVGGAGGGGGAAGGGGAGGAGGAAGGGGAGGGGGAAGGTGGAGGGAAGGAGGGVAAALCHTDDQCAASTRCAEGNGQCVPARNCNVTTDCATADPQDYCFGRGCRCVPGPNDAGLTGVCRRRLGPCEPCASDFDCGADAGFVPLGACMTLDAGGGPVCVQQKETSCPPGTIEDANGFCVPSGGICTPAPCANDLGCPADFTCNPTTSKCEPRCRWNFALGVEDPPACPPTQICWVDNANVSATSTLYGLGRCRAPCVGNSDCNVMTAANPFGGTNLKCAPEVLPDAGMSPMRCRANGTCQDDAECALPASGANKGYCNRATYACATDCRIATNPVTSQPFEDCNSPNTCRLDAGVNVCVP